MAWGTPTDAEIAALIGTRIPDCLFCAPARDDAQHPENTSPALYPRPFFSALICRSSLNLPYIFVQSLLAWNHVPNSMHAEGCLRPLRKGVTGVVRLLAAGRSDGS
jgi:hypothetical protein